MLRAASAPGEDGRAEVSVCGGDWPANRSSECAGSPGEDMLQEAAQELFARQAHGTLAAVMRVILPSKGHVGVGDGEDAVVGDCDTVSIAGQILQDMCRSAEGRLGVDHPILTKQGTQEGGEGWRVRPGKTFPIKGQSAVTSGMTQALDELPTKNSAEHFHRQEEVSG